MDSFHPLIRNWFSERFGDPTPPQAQGWPQIAAGKHTLIAAPTGSGKTLAAFLVCIDRLWREWLDGDLRDGVRVVYVSPLKALSNDVERNLQAPLSEIRDLALQSGFDPPPIRVGLRTGDTSSSERQRMLRRPPHILVTTPESLYLLLTSERSRQILRDVETVIVDEIHALARDKRGSHLSLTLERLSALSEVRPTRIGLSATQRPIEKIAKFLVGASIGEGDQEHSSTSTGDSENGDEVAIIDGGHAREMELAIEVPPSELTGVCTHEQWEEIYKRLADLIKEHRSTLIFVNTRRMAERVAHHLRGLLGEQAVAGHHGSLSKETRLSVEQRLKDGELKAIVATASLEMGIDIGYIDLVCQIGPPKSIATFLQRVGRSGHSVGALPQGRLFPLTLDELLECMALVGAARQGRLDAIEIPEQPIDILAQQIVAAVACEEWDEEALFRVFSRAWPFRNLTREQFSEILELLSTGVTPSSGRGIYLHRDQINGRVRAKKHARITALNSGGAIPETADYRVIAEPGKIHVGSVDEDFATESLAGDIFLLGNTSWQIQHIRGGEVVVHDAQGASPNIPFWFGEGPGRTIELSEEISALRERLESLLSRRDKGLSQPSNVADIDLSEYGVDWYAADQALSYVESQVTAIGLVPSKRRIVFERFFDESGGMQLVIHAALGSRINRAWGLALRKRFCRSFDFELQAAATDNGILLSLSPQHSFEIEALFKMIGRHNARFLLEQAVLAAPMFQVRWRWNATRALSVLRNRAGKRVPPYLQRFQSDDLLASAFPETVGCLENHHGDVEIPSHPLVQQTMHDCLTEAMDVDGWMDVLTAIESGEIELVAKETREPSPFAYELLNAQPYAFLDDAPLEERRTRAVSTRRGTVQHAGDLGTLDANAIQQVRDEAWPAVRSPDELHDTLLTLVLIPEATNENWTPWFESLICSGRATRLSVNDHRYWVAAEQTPVADAAYADATQEPMVDLPQQLKHEVDAADARTTIVRGWMQVCGPTTSEALAQRFQLSTGQVEAALEALEGQGIVLRGRFTPGNQTQTEWCDRRLLARIHRLTLSGLREQIKPVHPHDFMRFLIDRHRLSWKKWQGPLGVREAIGQLQGFQLPAGLWETRILEARCSDYDPAWMDQLFMTGEAMWARICMPRNDETGRRRSAVTRTMPISLMLRADVPWILTEREAELHAASANAQEVYDALNQRGALFFQEITAATQLLPTQVEESLCQLAACGAVTSDALAAVRAMIAGSKRTSRRRRAPGQSLPQPAGRWSLFPGAIQVSERADHVEQWCRLLLNRYGVVFRDLLTREVAAPPWRELADVYRRLEMRGEIRGGRFVGSFAGEQFATEDVVTELRATRDAQDQQWYVLSAADPLNLVGIIIDGPRIPAVGNNSIVLLGGHCVAANQSGKISFFKEVSAEDQVQMERSLQTGRRQARAHIQPRWQDNTASAPTEQASRPIRPK